MLSQKKIAIILAGGQGKRMKSTTQKQYLLIENKPVLYYSLKTFQNSVVDEIVLVVPKGEVEYCKKEIVERYQFDKVSYIVEGGKERYHSVYHALQAIHECGYVFIHDGARPFVDQEIINRAYECVLQYNACVVGVPVKDTIKIADDKGFAQHTPDRNLVWSIQTPQTFSFPLIKAAYDTLMLQEKICSKNITDDAMVVENFANEKIKLVKGSYTNLKITTPEDMKIANVLVKTRDFGND